MNTGIHELNQNNIYDVKDFLSLSSSIDTWACRIRCLYDSYSSYDNIARFYLQKNETDTTAVLSEYGGSITVYAKSNSDIDEIKAFIDLRGCGSVQGNIELLCQNGGICMKLSDRKKLYYSDSPDIEFCMSEPDHKTIYDLMCKCEDEDFTLPSYEDFIVEFSHRHRHGTAKFCCIVSDDRIVSFCMTAALSDTCAVIGSVCTLPCYRKKGYAGKCISRLIQSLDNREIFVIRPVNKNESFYSKLGFTEVTSQ